MKLSEPRLILLFAFRYALGRRTMAPSIVANELKDNWHLLTDFDKEKIKEEIYEHQDLGMSCDVETWNEILNL